MEHHLIRRGFRTGDQETTPPDRRPITLAWIQVGSPKNGAACVTRTRDPRITNAMLYQLS